MNASQLQPGMKFHMKEFHGEEIKTTDFEGPDDLVPSLKTFQTISDTLILHTQSKDVPGLEFHKSFRQTE